MEIFHFMKLNLMTNKQSLLLSLTKRRKALGLTQEQVAKQIGVSRVTIGLFERGQTNLSFDTLIKTLEVLELRIEVHPV